MLRSMQYTREMSKKTGSPIIKWLLSQQDFFQERKQRVDAAVEASYVVSEMITNAGKLFKDIEFIKQCMLQVASIVCLEKKGQVSNISLSAYTVAERNSDISGNIYDQLWIS